MRNRKEFNPVFVSAKNLKFLKEYKKLDNLIIKILKYID